MMAPLEPHLPILQVLVPLLGALLSGFIRRGTTAWAFALVVSWICPVISAWLLWKVMTTGQPISYLMGGWAVPWGIEYRVDALNAFVLMLVTSVGAVIMPFARRSVASEIDSHKQAWFYTMYLLCLTGLLGITVTGDAFNVFVFLEISSLSTYVLIALGTTSPRVARLLSVPDRRYDRRHLLCHRHRAALSRHGQSQHGRHRQPAWAGVGGVLAAGARRARIPDCWRVPEARAVPAARLAAERLCLCTVRRDGLSRRHRDQGRDLPSDPHLLLDLRCGHQLQDAAGDRGAAWCFRSRRCSSPR